MSKSETTATHSSTPWTWELIHEDDQIVIKDSNGIKVMVLDVDYVGYENAVRMLRCVNACHGLDPGALPGLIQACKELVELGSWPPLMEALCNLQVAYKKAITDH